MKIYKINGGIGPDLLTASDIIAKEYQKYGFRVTQFEVKTQGKNYNSVSKEEPFKPILP